MSYDLEKKVKELSRWLSDEAIAQALRITPEAVRDILAGKADIAEIRVSSSEANYGPKSLIQVHSVKTAYRQKIIAVCRVKGGVGCSVFALSLAYALSKELKTLLIDLNIAEGGSDLVYYLNLPDYPYLGAPAVPWNNWAVEVEPGFFVMQAPRVYAEHNINVQELVRLARQDYDAIVFDLPNDHNDLVGDAILNSNTVMAVTTGFRQELVRLLYFLAKYQNKDIFVIANQCKIDEEVLALLKDTKVINIERDDSLQRTFANCDLPREKSTFMKGVKQAIDALFERQEKKGLFASLLGG